MRLTMRIWFRRLRWLALPVGLLAAAQLAAPCSCADACGLAPPDDTQSETATARDVSEDPLEPADPWALSSTGNHLDTGYGPGQERPGLLP